MKHSTSWKLALEIQSEYRHKKFMETMTDPGFWINLMIMNMIVEQIRKASR